MSKLALITKPLGHICGLCGLFFSSARCQPRRSSVRLRTLRCEPQAISIDYAPVFMRFGHKRIIAALLVAVLNLILIIGCSGANQSVPKPGLSTAASVAPVTASESDTFKAAEPETQKPAVTPTPSSAAASESNKPEYQSVMVYVTETGSKYHSDGCRYLAKSKIAMTLTQAQRGYSPCSVCHPPK